MLPVPVVFKKINVEIQKKIEPVLTRRADFFRLSSSCCFINFDERKILMMDITINASNERKPSNINITPMLTLVGEAKLLTVIIVIEAITALITINSTSLNLAILEPPKFIIHEVPVFINHRMYSHSRPIYVY
jgi:hypothetical protein